MIVQAGLEFLRKFIHFGEQRPPLPGYIETGQLYGQLVDPLLKAGDPGGKPPFLALLHQPVSQPVQGGHHATVPAQSLVKTEPNFKIQFSGIVEDSFSSV